MLSNNFRATSAAKWQKTACILKFQLVVIVWSLEAHMATARIRVCVYATQGAHTGKGITLSTFCHIQQRITRCCFQLKFNFWVMDVCFGCRILCFINPGGEWSMRKCSLGVWFHKTILNLNVFLFLSAQKSFLTGWLCLLRSNADPPNPLGKSGSTFEWNSLYFTMFSFIFCSCFLLCRPV